MKPIFTGFKSDEQLLICACKSHFDSIFEKRFDALVFVYKKLYRHDEIDLEGMFHMMFQLWLKFFHEDLLYGQKGILMQELVLEAPCMDWFRGPKAIADKKTYLVSKIEKMASHIGQTQVLDAYELNSFDKSEIVSNPYYKKEYVY